MKKRLITAALVLLLLVAGILLLTVRQFEPFPKNSVSATVLAPGSYSVQLLEQRYVDKRRSTPANGDYSGDAFRQIDTKIWYPAGGSQGPYPVVVYNHGFSAHYDAAVYLGEQLASLGYVVIAGNFPLTHADAPGGPAISDLMNQPADVSFLIDSLLEQSQTAAGPLAGLVDATRIGVTGFSLGASTTLLVSFHPELRDTRIAAAVAIAGSTDVFTPVFFQHADMPFMMISGDADALVPYSANAIPALAKIPQLQLATIHGGSHMGFSDAPFFMRWLNNPDSMVCDMIQGLADTIDRKAANRQLGTQAQGINHDANTDVCALDPLPTAIPMERQRMLTTVLVSSFFQSLFAPDKADREAAKHYLRQTLPKELPDVSYQRSSQ